MLQLSRVRLLNWHNFVDDTLTFEKITVFGKTFL